MEDIDWRLAFGNFLAIKMSYVLGFVPELWRCLEAKERESTERASEGLKGLIYWFEP